jgi:hypothetical protein
MNLPEDFVMGNSTHTAARIAAQDERLQLNLVLLRQTSIVSYSRPMRRAR